MLRAIRLFSSLALVCLAVAFCLSLVAGAFGALCGDGCQSGLALTSGALALLAVPCGRGAVVCGLVHSSRTGRPRWFLGFAAICLYLLVASVVFTLRVNGWIHWNWALLGVPIEELGIALEAFTLAACALVYTLRPGIAATRPLAAESRTELAAMARDSGARLSRTLAPRVAVASGRAVVLLQATGAHVGSMTAWASHHAYHAAGKVFRRLRGAIGAVVARIGRVGRGAYSRYRSSRRAGAR